MEWLIPHIQKKGYLTIAEYMELCLYDPEHGYYTTANPFGVQGDFITAPEISQMFGEMIAACFVELWQRMGKPRVHMVEMGPGRGTLMADFLRVASSHMGDSIDVHMVEISPRLREIQQQNIGDRASWHDTLDEALEACQGPTFIIANELFDALPIQQRVKTEEGWKERCVVLSEDGHSLILTPTPDEEGRVLEECPVAVQIMTRMASHVKAYGGMALVIDYGCVGPEMGDSLQAVYKHQYFDVLHKPGSADLTAHVDFGALMEAASQAGATVYGPTIQGAFLMELGIAQRAAKLQENRTPEEKAEIEASLLRLVHPGQMGTLFKVLAVCGKNTPQPIGFSQCIQAAA